MAKIDAMEKRIAEAKKSGAKQETEKLENQLCYLRDATPDVPLGYFLSETKPAPQTFLLIRGSALNPGPEVQPAVPEVLAKAQPAFDQPRLATCQVAGGS